MSLSLRRDGWTRTRFCRMVLVLAFLGCVWLTSTYADPLPTRLDASAAAPLAETETLTETPTPQNLENSRGEVVARSRIDSYFARTSSSSSSSSSIREEERDREDGGSASTLYGYTVHEVSLFVRHRSLPGSEESLQAYIRSRLEAWFPSLGSSASIDLFLPNGTALAQSEHYVVGGEREKDAFRGSPVLIARIRGSGGEGARTLLLNGHVDVVPVGRENEWVKSEPWSGMYRNGHVYGRGSTDMKGGIVSSMLALRAIADSGITLRGDIVFQSVVEEERGGAGTLAATLHMLETQKAFPKPTAALIPEPTQLKGFVRQQGSMWFRITVLGKGAHGGTRYEGVSAIDNAYDVLRRLRILEQQRTNVLRHDPFYSKIPIPVPISVGKIHGGEWPSSVPDRVTLEGRMGISPYETVDEAKDALRSAISSFSSDENEYLSQHPPHLEFFGARWPPGKIDGDDILVNISRNAFQSVTGNDMVIEASPWATDGGILAAHGIPAFIFGPGTTAEAHQADESVSIDNVLICAHTIARILIEYCGVSEVTEYPHSSFEPVPL